MLKLKLLIVIFSFLFVSPEVYGQIKFEDPASQEIPDRDPPIYSFYGELFGSAYSFSLNLDYISKNNFGARVGLTPVFLFGNNRQNHDEYDDRYSQSFQFLIMGNYFIGKGSHKIELGGGFLFGFSDNNVNLGLPSYPAFSGSVGYRLIPKKENITLKLAFTPIFSGEDYFPRFGFSVGRIF